MRKINGKEIYCCNNFMCLKLISIKDFKNHLQTFAQCEVSYEK